MDTKTLIGLVHNFKEGTANNSLSLYLDKMQFAIDKSCIGNNSKSRLNQQIFSEDFSKIQDDPDKLNDLIHNLELYKSSNFESVKKKGEDLVYRTLQNFHRENPEFTIDGPDEKINSLQKEDNQRQPYDDDKFRYEDNQENLGFEDIFKDLSKGSGRDNLRVKNKKEPQRNIEETGYQPQKYPKRPPKKTSNNKNGFDDI